MIRQKLKTGIIAASIALYIFVILFYFVVNKIVATSFTFTTYPSTLTFKITLLFALFSVISFTFIVFYLLRDYKRKSVFSQEVKQFAEMIRKGELTDKVFFEEYPDLSDAYISLNDIMEDLKRKFELAETESLRLKTIIQSLPDALIIIDNREEIRYANEKVGKIFGKEDVLDKPLIEIIRNHELMDILKESKTFDKLVIGEISLDYPVELYLEATVSPFHLKNNLHGMVIILHNVTEYRKFEETRKDFVANVSHEIKTPLTAIKGFTETLIDGAINDKEHVYGFLSTILSHTERLNRLVDDLMILSKIELGVVKIQKIETDVSKIFDSVIDVLHPHVKEKRLTLSKNIKDNLSIMADRDKAMQILLNLVDNAIKFTEKGNIELGVGEEKGKQCIYVKDSGMGIPSKYINRLGERFFRVDTSRSRKLGGTGLGLAIVKHLVKAHGWTMKVESEEKKGTTVKVFYT